MLGKYFTAVRNNTPLVHNITNYVTVNDVANVILACGASPIMSDEPQDVKDITSICGGLNINIGTLCKRSIESMINGRGFIAHISRSMRHIMIFPRPTSTIIMSGARGKHSI